MRTAGDALTAPHEEPHTKGVRHEDASIEELVEYSDDDVKEGPTTRAHVIRRDEDATGSQGEARVNEECARRDAQGRYYATICVMQ